MKKIVEIIDVKQEKNYKNSGNTAYWLLGFYSKKSAYLINALLEHLLKQCRPKYGRSYCTEAHQAATGSILVKTDPIITINDFGEVGVYFRTSYNVNSYTRSATNAAQRLACIKDKMGYYLKLFWRSDAAFHGHKEDEHVMNISIDADNSYAVTFAEYRTLYEFLKGRSKAKSEKLYGKLPYKEMVGERLQNQFVFTAIETLQQRILEIENNYAATRNKLSNEADEKVREIRLALQSKLSNLESQKEDEVKELKAQIENMKQLNAMPGTEAASASAAV